MPQLLSWQTPPAGASGALFIPQWGMDDLASVAEPGAGSGLWRRGNDHLAEIELNRLIERFRSAVTAHALCKTVKTAQAVAEAPARGCLLLLWGQNEC